MAKMPTGGKKKPLVGRPVAPKGGTTANRGKGAEGPKSSMYSYTGSNGEAFRQYGSPGRKIAGAKQQREVRGAYPSAGNASRSAYNKSRGPEGPKRSMPAVKKATVKRAVPKKK